MNKLTKWIMLAGCMLLLTAILASCSTSRRIGCPMQITHHNTPVPVQKAVS